MKLCSLCNSRSGIAYEGAEAHTSVAVCEPCVLTVVPKLIAVVLGEDPLTIAHAKFKQIEAQFKLFSKDHRLQRDKEARRLKEEQAARMDHCDYDYDDLN